MPHLQQIRTLSLFNKEKSVYIVKKTLIKQKLCAVRWMIKNCGG